MSEEYPDLIISPIGVIRTSMRTKFDAPHQPDHEDSQTAVIELNPKKDFHKALEDLEGFERIWLVWWFHKNSSWRPKVMPPRGGENKRGVFATRSPHRPNPIGISVVTLLGISHLNITIGSSDLIDGTPILDIKPYIPSADAFPSSRVGWLEAVEEEFSRPAVYEVKFSDLAAEQIEWLNERGVSFIERAIHLLKRDPSENKTRRIKKHDENLFRMGCAEWRVFFTVQNNTVTVQYIQPGYTIERLTDDPNEIVPNGKIQLMFIEKWALK